MKQELQRKPNIDLKTRLEGWPQRSQVYKTGEEGIIKVPT